MSLAIVRTVAQRAASLSFPMGSRAIFGIKLPKYGPDPLDLATGLEKKEMLARATGNQDPFEIAAIKRGAGTKDVPTQIPSMEPNRIVGCICNEDSLYIAYMTLYMGEKKRCECGHWYELVQGKGITHASWIL
ncbi:hypothetical protein BV898_12604 [Hypsibius exemplaris]|uniref:Cytochrome c oxidase subunit 5B, mitochondrial n=1 Tax=Hypsibius exemplaris TaxID=2072580 RepID=A0A1W0WD86_HYPEX|nr:hypothetical protein BV898_12604 [Hypsibius exemplaris]